MQSRLRLENAIVPLTIPVRVPVDEPAAGPGAENVAQQTRDVDEADDGGAEVVRGDLEEEGGEDVDCDDPGEGDAGGCGLVGVASCGGERERERDLRVA